jgi:hypothetical protein
LSYLLKLFIDGAINIFEVKGMWGFPLTCALLLNIFFRTLGLLNKKIIMKLKNNYVLTEKVFSEK